MMWVPLVLFLGTFFSGSKSQLVLTQPPSVAESLGSTVRISCALKSDSNYNDQRVRWYQQQNGGVPRFIYHYRHGNTQERGSGVPERFTVSPEATNKLWYLVITGVQAEDDADYYCCTWDGTLSKYHSVFLSWGTETKTSVESDRITVWILS
uniref:Uncharacterized protein n=1 Tax=Sphaerodactylus townsendi TaxID=933632 RepID=A0ACB8FYT2_9SAUR